MDVDLVATPSALSAEFSKWCTRADKIWMSAAWSKDCPLERQLVTSLDKIERLVVGLEFLGTSPAFLRKTRDVVLVRDGGGATFHPKVYLFRKGNRFACFVGSSNFTGGGFGKNVETNVVLTGACREPFFESICRLIKEHADVGQEVTPALLADYSKRFQEGQKWRKKVSYRISTTTKRKIAHENQPEADRPPPSLAVSWRRFFTWVCRQEHGKRDIRIFPSKSDEDPGYLGTSEEARGYFEKRRTLAAMSDSEARFVAGTLRRSGYFGRMWGAGEFKALVNHARHRLDVPLGVIPLGGEVTEKHLLAFIRGWKKIKRVGVATGSRLLAMKRPDRFLCLDGANRRQIASAFGTSAASLNQWDGYRRLHLRIWRLSWAAAPSPAPQRERRIWSARVALLDAFYYLT